MNYKSIVGCMLGTAVGDALGLPYEGLRPDRAARLLGPPTRHRFFLGHGMISDDTEHTCMVAQSLMESPSDVDQFAKRFAWRLRWWILGLPAGVGKATARSGIKLWLGAKPQTSGVFSAGNGPAMRAAIFGAAIDDRSLMLDFVRASSRLTHSDPKAEQGAIAVALAARHARTFPTVDHKLWLKDVEKALNNEQSELLNRIRASIDSAQSNESTRDFADSQGLSRGITGYTLHTVPLAIHAWLSSPNDYRQAVTSIIECGGDADTTAAIVGGIVGAGVGRDGIATEWLDGIQDWPRSIMWIEHLAEKLADTLEPTSLGTTPNKAPWINPLAVVLRNLAFLMIVLFHGFRRLAPPY
ncbi:ADP-ribosylglycohydrolase family protein [Rhodopirellula baltica]|uniref:ADP-ribosylation/Crystallin J1 n=1 Tax=Rhodopirellula baltica WH47 TaxID=991778 RepID=F2B1F2_RHOBT|nr:ADP-ribosylglycohydrolase family protein [Rhodopirellula baltica]EGF24250.1 ADP-ribosylation/Crystallin J1 [Rhodopirellula baltica WH47]